MRIEAGALYVDNVALRDRLLTQGDGHHYCVLFGRASSALAVIVLQKGLYTTRTAHVDARTPISHNQRCKSGACYRRRRGPDRPRPRPSRTTPPPTGTATSAAATARRACPLLAVIRLAFGSDGDRGPSCTSGCRKWSRITRADRPAGRFLLLSNVQPCRLPRPAFPAGDEQRRPQAGIRRCGGCDRRGPERRRRPGGR
jgi:hypothetical protein